MYSYKVIENFVNPQNTGSIDESDGEATHGDASCGDLLNMTIKVSNGIIQDVKYLVFGCTASIATGSMITQLAKGKTIVQALKITEKDVIDALDGLPNNKMHCSNLGVITLRETIENYLNKKNLKV